MKHLGDITKISGFDIPAVDVITGGSPCQDLSVAGKRAGLSGERSGLFMEQIRIIKEMRERDRRTGRSDVNVRPRWCIWENVPGAFSSNGGKDFQAVLTEFAKVSDPDAPDVPMPVKGGWPKFGVIYDELGRWSVAYRLHDAQYWGVPQRRKRIALVADFNGLGAAEVLFDPQLFGEAQDSESYQIVGNSGREPGFEILAESESVSRNFESCGTERKETAVRSGTSSDSAIGLQGNGIGRSDEAGCNGAGWRVGGSYALNATDRHGVVSFQEQMPTKTDDKTYPSVAKSLTQRYDGSPCIDRGPNVIMTNAAEPNAISFQERAGKPGGGKGILIQNERTGALSTINNQSVVTQCPE